MADEEEWRFGDESSSTDCRVCGKANRAGQVHCAYCGTRLGAETDPDSLRTIGEAMAGGRPGGRRRRREHPWMWPAAAGALLAAVAVGYWWSAPAPRHLSLEDALQPAGGVAAARPTVVAPPAAVAPPVAAPSPVAVARPAPVATAVEHAGTPRPPIAAVASPRPPVAAAVPPRVAPSRAPIAVATPQVRPTTVGAAVPRPQPPAPPAATEPERRRPPARPPQPAATTAAPERPSLPPGPAGGEADAIAPAERRPAEERPALGTDLVEARRAYRAALATYNARADAYNTLADEVQHAEGNDPARAAALRARRRRGVAGEDGGHRSQVPLRDVATLRLPGA